MTPNDPLIQCKWGLREDEGSCNACQTRDEATILLVDFPTFSFRVCPACATNLRNILDVYL